MILFILFLCSLAMTFPLAHIIGWRVARSHRVAPGNIREAMPSLPTAPPTQGKAEKRWDEAMHRVEGRLLARFADGVQGAEATQLAGALNEDPSIVEAVLARLREEVPCRMQITRAGLILHDFQAADIATLTRKRTRNKPRQLMLTALAAMANIGAAWPFLATIGIASFALYSMNIAQTEDEMLVVGLTGLLGAVILLVGTFVSGFIARLLFTPLTSGPRLGSVTEREDRPQRLVNTNSQHGGYDPLVGDLIFWNAMTSHHHSPGLGSSSLFGSSSSRSSGSSSGGFSLDFDGDDAQGVIIVIVVVALLALIAASLAALIVWVRGLWRAMGRLDEPPSSTSPAIWVRAAEEIDKWEKYIPTNDLVLRTLHAVKRHFDHQRPPDDDLAARLLVLAKSRGGTLTALEICMREGLDHAEANEIGARLCARLGGQILVTDDGELAFHLPLRALEGLVATPEEDMGAEYVSFDRQGKARRRTNQPNESVPVNLVGLTKNHLNSSDRLVAGTYIMTLMLAALISPEVGIVDLNGVLVFFLMIPLLAMALGTAALNATARYTAKESAAQGVRRDIRRAAFKHVTLALRANQSVVDLETLRRELLSTFKKAWSGIEEDLIARELRAVAIDLELEPSTQIDHAGKDIYQIDMLRQRLYRDRGFLQAFDFEQMDQLKPHERDEVVFDTQIEHAEVRALGRV